jgi:hypothetical protein
MLFVEGQKRTLGIICDGSNLKAFNVTCLYFSSHSQSYSPWATTKNPLGGYHSPHPKRQSFDYILLNLQKLLVNKTFSPIFMCNILTPPSWRHYKTHPDTESCGYSLLSRYHHIQMWISLVIWTSHLIVKLSILPTLSTQYVMIEPDTTNSHLYLQKERRGDIWPWQDNNDLISTGKWF